MFVRPLRSLLLVTLAFTCLGTLQAETPVRLLVKNATLLTLEPGNDKPFLGYFTVDAAGRLQTISAGAPPAGLTAQTTYDATGKIVIPGFISAHSHLYESAFRGTASDQTLFGWLAVSHGLYEPFFVKGDFYQFTLHGALDYLRHGITASYNWINNRESEPQAYEHFDAELAAGQRFYFGYNTNSKYTEQVNHDHLRDFIAYAKKQEGNPIYLGFSLAGGGLVYGPEQAAMEARFIKEFHLFSQHHYLEPPETQIKDRADFHLFKDLGILGPNLNFAHFVHPDDAILKEAAAAGVTMSWNPLSNGRLASGRADVVKYLKAGLKVGMGLDGQASADIADPFENMRMGLYAMRMQYESAKVMQPIDVLRLHTLGSAQVLHMDDKIGTLKPGKFADFLVVDPSQMDTGPVFDVAATLVFSCSVVNLERVYVGGELKVNRGEIQGFNFKALHDDVYHRVAEARRKQAESLRNKLK
jgi:cytosine/adenosine deaminase-related metal-dependent hydrolase